MPKTKAPKLNGSIEPKERTASRYILLDNRRWPLSTATGRITLYETVTGARKARGKMGGGFIAKVDLTYRWGEKEVAE